MACRMLWVFAVFYIVSETWIGGRFLEDFFYCYSQQIISTEANESPILYNTECQPKANKKTYSSVSETKDFAPQNVNN